MDSVSCPRRIIVQILLNFFLNTIRKSVLQLVPVAALDTMVGDGLSTPTLKKKFGIFFIRIRSDLYFVLYLYFIINITIAHSIFEQ